MSMLPGFPDALPATSSLSESDRYRGAAVFDRRGKRLGVVERVFVEQASGLVVYADLALRRFLGLGARRYTIDWEKLTSDPSRGGLRADITEAQLARPDRAVISAGRLLHGRW